MTLEEFKLHRLVQGILVRNYVDTQKLQLQIIGSSVYLEGDFCVFDYHPSQKKTDRIERDLSVGHTLRHVEQAIRGLAEVNHLEMKLTNWERRGLQWVTLRESV